MQFYLMLVTSLWRLRGVSDSAKKNAPGSKSSGPELSEVKAEDAPVILLGHQLSFWGVVVEGADTSYLMFPWRLGSG